ncbi:MAG: tRNA (5-methylaminomethyl-2-thiouridine)(34)-methyltransferase MnmD [Cytophagaceae bacterium]
MSSTDELKIILSSDGSHSLYNPKLNETYHSTHGALNESKYVYIEKGLAEIPSKEIISVIEIGFGTGLNTLLTLLWAKEHQQKIHYHTLEPYPLSLELIQQLNYAELLNADKADFLRLHQVSWGDIHEINEYFSFIKTNQKVEDTVLKKATYDICYFDAFAPNKQQEMWEVQNFEKIFETLHSSGKLVTYCAQGVFKRTLKAAGFKVESLPGPPYKKEMTRGVKV